MKSKTLFALFLLIGMIACEDDEMMTTVPPDQIQFGGITPTDVNGQATGNPDPTDWQLQDQWEDRISDLFGGASQSLCSDAAEYQAFAASPNPAVSQVLLFYNLKDSADLAMRIVDRDYQVLKEIEVNGVFGPGFNELVINLDELNISNDTIRMYYKIVRPDCELRGHGDVVVQ